MKQKSLTSLKESIKIKQKVFFKVLEYFRLCNIFYLINGPRVMFGIFD